MHKHGEFQIHLKPFERENTYKVSTPAIFDPFAKIQFSVFETFATHTCFFSPKRSNKRYIRQDFAFIINMLRVRTSVVFGAKFLSNDFVDRLRRVNYSYPYSSHEDIDTYCSSWIMFVKEIIF